jgi:hypothetical protein
MRSLGRVFAAAAGITLLIPAAASASWWDGGYDGGYDARQGSNPTTTTTNRAAPGYGEREPGTSPDYGEEPDYGRPDYSQPPESGPPADCNMPCGPPPVPPPPPPYEVGPMYGCENSTLPGTELALHKTTTPPPGTPVAPGDEILVDITWDVHDWIGPDVHKAIDCVYIGGVLVEWLSGGERPTPNDGHFAYHYIVPLDAPIGAEICDQGFVSGPNGYDDYFREVSNVVCFPICAPAEQPPPPPPAVEETTTTTTTVPEEEQPYTQAERFEQEAPPAPVVQSRDVLPRTGSGPDAARLAAAGLALLTLIGRRTRRR